MAGNVSPSSAPRSRYIPRGHPVSWWMLIVTTGAILITSIDRALLPTVLPGILKEFNLSETAGGVLVGLSFAGTMAGGLVLGVFLWGTVSDHEGQKWLLSILAVGWAATVLLMIFISSGALGWIILIGWGVFRNSPFPVMYASIIDAVPDGASSGLGLMIGIGLGSAGFLAAPVAGFIVQHYGFTWHYIFLAVICLLTLVPISMIRETSAGQEESAVPQGT
jgi:MFS family permease